LHYHLRMPLLSFWKNNRDEVLKMTVEQVVSSAGDGHLRDGSEAAKEFRGNGWLHLTDELRYFKSAISAPFGSTAYSVAGRKVS
jgi:hypothetical protein